MEIRICSFSYFEMNMCLPLVEPQPHAVDDAYREEDCSRQKEAPQAFAEASEDVIEPCKKAGQSDDCADSCAHGVLLYSTISSP